jgi:aryl-alcohol dehydrogenase-like predicted oxidoreductase
MKTRNLGSEGLTVSTIGLGCMGIDAFSAEAAERDESQVIKVIHRALELGINLFDTAEEYGPFTNEEFLGKSLKSKRDQAVIATKFGWNITGERPYALDSRPEKIKVACDTSLSRLGIEVIDLYYQHRVDPNVPIEDVAGTVGELIRAGKVRFFGLSEAGPETIRRAHRIQPVSALQTEYSIWERDLEDRIMPVLKELGIGLVPYSPLGRGFLTASIAKLDDLHPDDFRRCDPRYLPANFAQNLALLQAIEEVAQKASATPGQVALAWVLQQGHFIVPIPGTRRLRHLEENAEAVQLTLSSTDLRQLDALAPRTAGDRKPPEGMARVGL